MTASAIIAVVAPPRIPARLRDPESKNKVLRLIAQRICHLPPESSTAAATPVVLAALSSAAIPPARAASGRSGTRAGPARPLTEYSIRLMDERPRHGWRTGRCLHRLLNGGATDGVIILNTLTAVR